MLLNAGNMLNTYVGLLSVFIVEYRCVRGNKT